MNNWTTEITDDMDEQILMNELDTDVVVMTESEQAELSLYVQSLITA